MIILVTEVNRALSGEVTSTKTLEGHVWAFSAPSWSRLLFGQVGGNQINLFLAPVRRSPADRSIVRGVVDGIRAPLKARKSMAPIPCEA